MKLPEPLFVFINPAVLLLLKSPLHWLLSSSVMLITFKGRRSGNTFTTPVRYIEEGGVIRCFTARTNQWWRNMREPARVTLLVAGRERTCEMKAIYNEADKVRRELTKLLKRFPQDAPYYEVELGKNKEPRHGHLERAAEATVLVEVHARISDKDINQQCSEADA